MDLQSVFDSLVDVTEPICQAIDSSKADMTIFDSSGIEVNILTDESHDSEKLRATIPAVQSHFDLA